METKKVVTHEVRNYGTVSHDVAKRMYSLVLEGKQRPIARITFEQADRMRRLFTQAVMAGNKAGEEAIPRPMIVTGGILGGKKESWYVSEGMCGFAWVDVPDKTCELAQYMMIFERGYSDYPKVHAKYWVSEFNQSYERKLAYAKAMAKVFRDAGFEATYDSRLD